MKNLLKKIISILDHIYGWSILICLFVGGATFFGYVAAFIIGGDTAALICDIISKILYVKKC